MPKSSVPQTGGGRLIPSNRFSLRNVMHVDIHPVVDLNGASYEFMAAHKAIGSDLAKKTVALRKKRKITTPEDLFQEGLVNFKKLRSLEQTAFGVVPVRPMVTGIAAQPARLYVGEPFGVRVDFLKGTINAAEVLSIAARFPSGQGGTAHFRIRPKDRKAGYAVLKDFVSTESGEFHIVATIRDESGRVHQGAATFGIFTRNPVQMYFTPFFLTQSGTAAAPKYDFDQDRWYCQTNVRWVNSGEQPVNLGKTVEVRIRDGGVRTDSFSMDLDSDIVVPALSTVYGWMYTWHGSGSGTYNVFMNKGDVSARYRMAASGEDVVRHQQWRTMRVIGYNIIGVGDFDEAVWTGTHRAAGEFAPGIFQRRDMTVYAVEEWVIEGSAGMDADKARFRFIDSDGELDELFGKYSCDNVYLDVFLVEGMWDGALGRSGVNGSADKSGSYSGFAIVPDGDTQNLGVTFAHETGHYLGLEHADENDGCDDTDPADANISDNFIHSSGHRDSNVVTRCQIEKMIQHGLVFAYTP